MSPNFTTKLNFVTLYLLVIFRQQGVVNFLITGSLQGICNRPRLLV